MNQAPYKLITYLKILPKEKKNVDQRETLLNSNKSFLRHFSGRAFRI